MPKVDGRPFLCLTDGGEIPSFPFSEIMNDDRPISIAHSDITFGQFGGTEQGVSQSSVCIFILKISPGFPYTLRNYDELLNILYTLLNILENTVLYTQILTKTITGT